VKKVEKEGPLVFVYFDMAISYVNTPKKIWETIIYTGLLPSSPGTFGNGVNLFFIVSGFNCLTWKVIKKPGEQGREIKSDYVRLNSRTIEYYEISLDEIAINMALAADKSAGWLRELRGRLIRIYKILHL